MFTQDFINEVCSKMNNGELSTEELFKFFLDHKAKEDADFAKMYAKENKSFENCWKYITIEVEKQAREGKAHSFCTNVFKLLDLAFHYYNEDSIDEELKEKEKPKAVVSSAQVVPMQKVVKQAPKKESKNPQYVQLSLFD
ncbi:MAG: PcfK-like family protein [Paludibacteraceae bacterium]|nr:PcfK-like family protein [Paludibacteraceae bacterium]